MVIYYMGFQSGLGYLQSVLRGLSGLYEDNLFLVNFYQFLDLKPHITVPEHPLPVPQPMPRAISLRGVSFTYPSREEETLHDVSLDLAPGKREPFYKGEGSACITAIQIEAQPQNEIVIFGNTANFNVNAIGTTPLGYQWLFGGSPMEGAAATILNLTNTQFFQAGAYSLMATNAFGAVTSAPAMLSVIPAVERRMVPALTLIGQPGSGGSGHSGSSGYYGCNGGGLVRIKAGTLSLNGIIVADGAFVTNGYGSGSGGGTPRRRRTPSP